MAPVIAILPSAAGFARIYRPQPAPWANRPVLAAVSRGVLEAPARSGRLAAQVALRP
jgi:hypothetical protein